MNRTPEIKAAFFDLGKVLMAFRHEVIIERLLSRAETASEKTGPLFEFLFDARTGLCNRYDEGNISSRGFYIEIDSRFDLGVDYEGFIPLWNDIFTEKTDTFAVMRAVRNLMPVYLLSNINELHWDYICERYPSVSEMDGWILSYRLKTKKPAREIFEAAVKLAGVERDETIFIDDLPENTAAAGSMGINCITFTGAGNLATELARFGIAVR